jgi:hypothetical protein
MLNAGAGARVQVREEHDKGLALTQVRTPPGTVVAVRRAGAAASILVKLDSGETMPFLPGELDLLPLPEITCSGGVSLPQIGAGVGE